MKKIKIFSIVLCLAEALSASAQTDYTSLIVNPSFESKSFNGWTQSNLSLQSNNSFTKKAGTYYAEKWVASGSQVGAASLKQTVRGIPNGKYILTVAAQNYNQASTSTNCTGAYIYANTLTNRTSVNQPNDYEVSFSVSKGEVVIGYNVLVGATGNWVCVDNFRLTKVGEIDKSVAKTSCDSLVSIASGLLSNRMTKEPYEALSSSIVLGQSTTAESTDEAISEATVALELAIYNARNSISECTSLAKSLVTAKTYQGKYMQQTVSDVLDAAIASASAVGNTTSEAEFQKIVTALSTSTDNAATSSTAYTSLNSAIVKAEAVYDASKLEADIFLAAITEAKTMYSTKEADATTVDAETASITKAQLAFCLANSTKGNGTAIAVTSTNNYVPTGATQALMRFEYTGSNIKEKGVCWSTEHNPTVLDDRTTEILGNVNGDIYRVSGLQNATVYYLRPYVMNTTYEVVYGDEVKIVTHPKGTCTWSWDNAGPDDATNTRCSTAIKQTIDYFNEWTGIKGFNLSGHYVPGAGSGSGTADCSYGGYMRISQTVANQAIGTVLHETGHGVGVGTQTRYWDTNVHNTRWYGSETSKMYAFLENRTVDPYDDNCSYYWRGDSQHSWGQGSTYDWLINGSDKDKHIELQYAGGCCLLYAMFVDGLCPTTAYTNGLAGYTYNFDDTKKYYIMCKDADRGLGTGLLYEYNLYGARWKDFSLKTARALSDSAAWYMGYNPETGCYTFKNASAKKYLSHSTSMSLKNPATPGTTEEFQLMPARKDVTITGTNESFTAKGYWFTWDNQKSMSANAMSTSGVGSLAVSSFDFSDSSTTQQWIILSEDEMQKYWSVYTGIEEITSGKSFSTDGKIYSIGGQYVGKSFDTLHSGLYIINGKKIIKK